VNRAGFLESAALQNPAAFAVRPDLFPDYAENMGGGVARLVRYVDTPGGSWEVVYVEDGLPFVVCVTPVTPAHDYEVGPVAVAEFVTAWDALREWEVWHPGSALVLREVPDSLPPADVPPVCAGCGVSVAPESGVLVHELWAGMTGELVCRSCWESTGECDTCGGGTNWSDNGTCASCQRGLGGAE